MFTSMKKSMLIIKEFLEAEEPKLYALLASYFPRHGTNMAEDMLPPHTYDAYEVDTQKGQSFYCLSPILRMYLEMKFPDEWVGMRKGKNMQETIILINTRHKAVHVPRFTEKREIAFMIQSCGSLVRRFPERDTKEGVYYGIASFWGKLRVVPQILYKKHETFIATFLALIAIIGFFFGGFS